MARPGSDHVGIDEIQKGDFVRVGGAYHEIESVWGVDKNGRLAKPSEGGFGVVTTDGRRVDMFNAWSYHKRVG